MDYTTIFYITIAVTLILSITVYFLIKQGTIENFTGEYTEKQKRDSERYLSL